MEEQMLPRRQCHQRFPNGSAGMTMVSAFCWKETPGRKKGELIQAAQAFEQVEKLGRADGPVNLARVYFKEGRLDDAVSALQRASKFEPLPAVDCCLVQWAC